MRRAVFLLLSILMILPGTGCENTNAFKAPPAVVFAPTSPKLPTGTVVLASTLPPIILPATGTPVPGNTPSGPMPTLITLSPAVLTATPSLTASPTPWLPTSTSTPELLQRSSTPEFQSTHSLLPSSGLLVTPTRQVTLTPTPSSTPIPPQPYLRIQRPGLLSKVVSPIVLEIFSTPGDDGYIHIELFGEDGRLITRQDVNHRGFTGRFVWTGERLAYEIPAVAETALLRLSIVDRFRRVTALTSVDLILLKVGKTEYNPPALAQEPFVIYTPESKETLSGGKMIVTGLARPVNDTPLIIELISEDGTIVGSARVPKLSEPAPGQSLALFAAEVAYRVNEPTPVRLTLRQESKRAPLTVTLTSMVLVVAP